MSHDTDPQAKEMSDLTTDDMRIVQGGAIYIRIEGIKGDVQPADAGIQVPITIKHNL